MRDDFNTVVENKPGAAGRIALGQLKAAKPDGLTLAIAPSPGFVLFPHLYKKLDYDATRDFTPICELAIQPFAVTTGADGVFVLAARASRADEVAVAIRKRLSVIAPLRLSGTRPGILAMLVEDTDRIEWRALRERLELEGEARQFLAHPSSRGVIAVTCASRLEMLGASAPDAAPEGEMRFRNPSHPAAKVAGLAPAVLSSV